MLRSLAASAIAAVWAPLYARAGEDIGYNLLWTDALDEFSDRCVKASAPIPAWAHGDFIIPSVGRFEMGDRRFVGQLDAFGKMQRFELRGDEVCATYRMMATGFYNQSREANTIGHGLLFFETEPPRTCPWWNPVCNMVGAPNDNTFVNTIRHSGKLLSITDAPTFLELDPRSMNVTGVYKFEDDLAGQVCYTGSAHPVPHPVTGDWIDFVGNARIFSKETTVRVFSLSDKDPRKRQSVADVIMDKPPYMHSFGATAKHVVLPRMPIEFDAASVATKAMHSAFKEVELSQPGQDNGFHVIPLDGSGVKLRPLPVAERLYFTHTVNTYENETGIVIDLCTLAVNPFAGNLTVAAGMDKATRDKNPHNVVRRFLLPHADGVPVTSEALSDPTMAMDFTKMNPRYAGSKHCFFWGVEWFTDKASYGSMAIVKIDLCGGSRKLMWRRENWYPSEASFVPAPEPAAAEDDGLLLFTALDGAKGETHLIVLNAATMELVSQVGPFPRIGFTTHGEFYPAAAAWGGPSEPEAASLVV
mmetsp:Transcript_34391/g.109177  ORF Transcript_34391/g.109177 Transcript_34391/m.109177 type:complete len:530 (+) Transcript_34391:57-1646(+)